jgi:hypothetical protein
MKRKQEETPLKNKTAWNHLQTIQRAMEKVNSWPQWKRDRILFRDKNEMEASDVPAESEGQRKRSA